MKRLAVVVVVAAAIILGIAYSGGRAGAQDDAEPTDAPTVAPTVTPLPTPTAYPLRSLTFRLVAQTDARITTDGPSVVSVATVQLPARSETIPLQTEGITVFTVQSGTVTVSADELTVAVPDISASIGLQVIAASPIADGSAVLDTGNQVVVPAGALVSVRNDADVVASVVILTIVPIGPAVTPTP